MQYIVQPFIAAKGRVSPGKPVEAKTAEACIREARRRATGGGAAALAVELADGTGDIVSIKVLERIGVLPADFDANVGA